MAFALIAGESVLMPSSAGALRNFAVATTLANIRLTNTSGSTVSGINLWADYDGTGTGDVDQIVDSLTLLAGESVMVGGGPFNFASGGRLSGVAGTASVISVHTSGATI